jgi:hypothetical protein
LKQSSANANHEHLARAEADWGGAQDGELGDGIVADPDETTTTETFDLNTISPADDTRIYVRGEKEPNG